MIAAAALLAPGAGAQTMTGPASLEVVIAPVRSTAGSVRVSLYNSAAAFRKEAQALKVLTLPAQQGEVRARFDDLPAGRYAVMAYHDENANGKLDLRLGMFPIEGYGLSNNPKVMGPPAFDDSAFQFEQAGQRITVQMRY